MTRSSKIRGGEVGAGAEQDQDEDGDQELAHEAAQSATGRCGRASTGAAQPPEKGGSRASSAPSGTAADGSRQRSPSTSTLE